MAGSKIKGINIKIGADTRGLDTALKSIEAKSKSARDELREINKTLKSTPDSLTAWKQKQEVLTKAIADSREKVRLLADGKISGEQYRAFERELVQYITEKMPEIQEKSEQAFDVTMTSVEWAKKNMPEIKKKLNDLLSVFSAVVSVIAGLTIANTTKKDEQGI